MIFIAIRKYKLLLILLLLLWLPPLFAGLSKHPNIFTALFINRWTILLPGLSIGLCLLEIARVNKMKVVFTLSILVLLLTIIIAARMSLWLSVTLENKTASKLTAVSVDLKNGYIRKVNIYPERKKMIVLINADDLKTAKGLGYHIFVYDANGKCYYDQTIAAEQLTRIHLITIQDGTGQ